MNTRYQYTSNTKDTFLFTKTFVQQLKIIMTNFVHTSNKNIKLCYWTK